jgi:hypothetical protein
MRLAVALIVVTAASAGAQESNTERMIQAYERGQASRVRKSDAELNEARARLAAMEAEAIRQQTERMQALAAAETRKDDAALQVAAEDAIAALAVLEKIHPDWKQYGKEMSVLREQFWPAQNVTLSQYLLSLYAVSSRLAACEAAEARK